MEFSSIETKINKEMKKRGFKVDPSRTYRFSKMSIDGKVKFGVAYANRDDGDGAERRFYTEGGKNVISNTCLTYNIIIYDEFHSKSLYTVTRLFSVTDGVDDISSDFYAELDEATKIFNKYNESHYI